MIKLLLRSAEVQWDTYPQDHTQNSTVCNDCRFGVLYGVRRIRACQALQMRRGVVLIESEEDVFLAQVSRLDS